MKSMARAILFSGFVAATTAAVGDKLSGAMGERENGQEAASSAQADPQASDPTMSVESAASTEGAATSPDAVPQPSEYATVTPSPSTDIVAAVPPPPAESVARRVPARAAYEMTSTSAFPGSSDDAGYRVPPRITYASLHGDGPIMTASSVFPASSDDAATTPSSVSLGRQSK